MEYTLEDAFEALKETEIEREKEIENLSNIISNNEVNALDRSSGIEVIKTKQHKLCKSLLKLIEKEEPKDYPIPRTSDLHVEVIRELEEEIQNTQELFANLKARLSEVEDDIAYLEKKELGLKNMKEAYLGATKTFANRSYDTENSVTKRLFLEVKQDLRAVVDVLFPNDEFKELLMNLTRAYIKGGDDTYVDINPEVLSYVKYLIEADIVVYHRNDKSKIRMADMF